MCISFLTGFGNTLQLSGMKIMAKFGARGHVPAMLCFYELMEQEQRNKLASNVPDRISMTNLALVGRTEQYLRHGKSVIEMLKNPKMHLRLAHSH